MTLYAACLGTHAFCTGTITCAGVQTYVQTTQPVTLALSISTTGCVCSEEIGVKRVSRNDKPNYLNRLWTLHTSPCVATKKTAQRKIALLQAALGRVQLEWGNYTPSDVTLRRNLEICTVLRYGVRRTTVIPYCIP